MLINMIAVTVPYVIFSKRLQSTATIPLLASFLVKQAHICKYYIFQGAVSTRLGAHMYIAVALALFCLIFTLIVFICLKDLKSNYIYSQINQLLCFCLGLIVFISGADSSQNQVNTAAANVNYLPMSQLTTIVIRSCYLMNYQYYHQYSVL